jgi:hypothetical protein
VAKLANGKVIIIDSGKDQRAGEDAQQAYRWLVPEDIQDEPAVASQLEMPRELRTALILRGEVVLDTRQRKKVSEYLDYHKAIVIDPAMINFMSAEPYPVYVREFYVNASGLHQFRQPTVDEMLHQIKHCYFNESDLDEMVPRKALAHALVTTMHEVEKHTHVVEVHLTLHGVSAAHAAVLAHALIDMGTGHLPIGGGTRRGNGRLKFADDPKGFRGKAVSFTLMRGATAIQHGSPSQDIDAFIDALELANGQLAGATA